MMMFAKSIADGIIEIIPSEYDYKKKDVPLKSNSSIAGFNRTKGSYDNLWDWRSLESVEFKLVKEWKKVYE